MLPACEVIPGRAGTESRTAGNMSTINQQRRADGPERVSASGHPPAAFLLPCQLLRVMTARLRRGSS